MYFLQSIFFYFYISAILDYRSVFLFVFAEFKLGGHVLRLQMDREE